MPTRRGSTNLSSPRIRRTVTDSPGEEFASGFAKTHGWTSGLLPPDTFSLRLFDYLYLERGLILGAATFLTGVGLTGYLGWFWWANNMGALDLQVTVRATLWAFTTLVLGLQTMFGSFFLSMLGMTEKAREARAKAKAAA